MGFFNKIKNMFKVESAEVKEVQNENQLSVIIIKKLFELSI